MRTTVLTKIYKSKACHMASSINFMIKILAAYSMFKVAHLAVPKTLLIL
jgi:hypothetical protein